MSFLPVPYSVCQKTFGGLFDKGGMYDDKSDAFVVEPHTGFNLYSIPGAPDRFALTLYSQDLSLVSGLISA